MFASILVIKALCVLAKLSVVCIEFLYSCGLMHTTLSLGVCGCRGVRHRFMAVNPGMLFLSSHNIL